MGNGRLGKGEGPGNSAGVDGVVGGGWGSQGGDGDEAGLRTYAKRVPGLNPVPIFIIGGYVRGVVVAGTSRDAVYMDNEAAAASDIPTQYLVTGDRRVYGVVPGKGNCIVCS